MGVTREELKLYLCVWLNESSRPGRASGRHGLWTSSIPLSAAHAVPRFAATGESEVEKNNVMTEMVALVGPSKIKYFSQELNPSLHHFQTNPSR